MGSRILELFGLSGVDVLKALASETRLRILILLAEGERNIHELAAALGLAQPSITRHVNVLEEAGLIRSELSPGVQGLQKRCRLCYDRLTFLLEAAQPQDIRIEEIEMPLGMYTQAHAVPTCGLANRDGMIWWDDDPQAFFHPNRASAQVLWMADGFVEYVFPNTLPAATQLHQLELVLEICSEAENYNNDFPSDITVWFNGVEVGTWTSPGDMGGTRGRLNPEWWHDHNTQYGFIKVWAVNHDGAFVDGERVGDTTLSGLRIALHQPITVRIGVKPDAVHRGGFNLFGHGFGNHEQDLVLRLHYSGTVTRNETTRTGPLAPVGSVRSAGQNRAPAAV